MYSFSRLKISIIQKNNVYVKIRIVTSDPSHLHSCLPHIYCCQTLQFEKLTANFTNDEQRKKENNTTSHKMFATNCNKILDED